MKKILAILLVLAMLVPMGLVANAEEVETRPFVMLNWSGFESELDNVYPMPYLWSDKNTIEEGEMPYVAYGGVSDMDALALKLKETLDTYPEGARYANFCLVHDSLRTLYEDACILEKGVSVVQLWLEAFLPKYKAIGGKLDGLVIDLEYFNVYSHYIHSVFYFDDPLIYDKIVKNPVYQEKIRPQLVERGFSFYPNISEQTPEIYTIHPNAGDQYTASRAIWDSVMRSYANDCVTRSCEALWKYYPDAMLNDYQSKDVDPWQKEMADAGGVQATGGLITTAGNSSNENFYSVRPYTSFYRNNKGPVYQTIPSYTKTLYEETPFTALYYDAVLAKTTYLSADTGHVSWWISHYIYNIANKKSVSNTPYYTESLYHLGMLNPDIFLGYILQGEVTAITGGDGEPYEIGLEIIDDILGDLTRVVGAADRKAIAVDANWNHQYVLSGMYAGGKNYWRITPDTDKVSLENFKVEGADPTFCVGGETVTFPGGKILEEGNIRVVGTCGYWIETPADVVPIVTRQSNYFEKHPAFGDDFERYAVGTEYNYTNAYPEACWEAVKQAGGAATVVADPTNADNQMAALKGTYTLKNVNMPANLLAGDSYAKHQAWQITFQLPADLPAEAELTLLNAVNEKRKNKDGGFKISGGKVYYTDGEEYVEMPDVALSAGIRYTVVRDMDFTNEEAVTCDYYVYAGDTLLGKAMDVAVANIAIPVYSVSYGVKGVTGEAVLFDDYKLYQTHVTTDFFLYDGKTGLQIQETDVAKAGDVVYRLSWLNATQEDKSYTVMAAYYNGDTLVEEKAVSELKLAANGDGVITGTVENKTQGQTVKVYLKDNNSVETDVPTDDGNDDQTEENGGNMLIIIIAAAAVVVVASVVVIIIASKKKKNTPTAE